MKTSKEYYRYEVSVIIPTYNRSQLLGYVLESLANQDLDKSKFEVIIGDDGSNDDTREIVEKYIAKVNLKYVFQEDKGYRPASARNKAIRCAEGRICLLIDSGVILSTTCLSEHIAFHSKNSIPRAAIGYVYGFDHDEASENHLKEIIDPFAPDLSIKILAQHKEYRDVREKHYVKYNFQIENLPAPWFYFWTCHLSVCTDDLVAVNLFDENFDGRWGGEDCDLGFRLFKNGVGIALLKTAQSIHYPHGKDKIDRTREGYQACIYLHNKFNTLETKILLDNYDKGSLVDINDILIREYSSAGIRFVRNNMSL